MNKRSDRFIRQSCGPPTNSAILALENPLVGSRIQDTWPGWVENKGVDTAAYVNCLPTLSTIKALQKVMATCTPQIQNI